MRDISFDLESLNVRNHGAILSIGACLFDRNTGDIGDTFYREINIDDAIRFGSISASTLCWWVGQSQKAKVLFSESREKTPMVAALGALSAWVTKHCGTGAIPWGNGATFDISLLETAYERALGKTPPWEFGNIRDLRTAVELSGFNPKSIVREGVHHNALDDAIHQAKIACACCWLMPGAKKAATSVNGEDDEL